MAALGALAVPHATSTAPPSGSSSNNPRPSFTLLPLGTGGGPLETDLSAYLVKPASTPWSNGCISLEAGSGIGALVELFGKARGAELWRQFAFEDEGSDLALAKGEVWMAGRVMETVRAYLVTHAHLDHVLSLILGSGGLPPPCPPVPPPQLPTPSPGPDRSGRRASLISNSSLDIPWSNTRAVYGSLETLVNLQTAFEERIWPDIGGFEHGAHSTKVVRFLEIAPTTSEAEASSATPGSTETGASIGCSLRSRSSPSASPLLLPPALPSLQTETSSPSTSFLPPHFHQQVYTSLPTSPPLSVLAFPISHGTCSSALRRGSRVAGCCGAQLEPERGVTSSKRRREDGNGKSRAHGVASDDEVEDEATGDAEPLTTYEASAFFVRLDERDPSVPGGRRRKEFCFFGDVEPDSISLDPRNRRVWEEVAYRFQAGMLTSVFLECSYDDSRPDSLLYGHLCPRHILAELAVLHSLVAAFAPSTKPPASLLKGLKVHIIHVKETLESLAEDAGGIRGRVLRQLEEGKRDFQGGILREVEFVIVKKGEVLYF